MQITPLVIVRALIWHLKASAFLSSTWVQESQQSLDSCPTACALTGRNLSEERGGLESYGVRSCSRPQPGQKFEARRHKLAAASPFCSLLLA